MTEIEAYYNKFNEEKRLLSRHGQVEYTVTMHHIAEVLAKRKEERGLLDTPEDRAKLSIIDIGAGTGRYAVALAEQGYDVTAVELVKYNLGILKKKGSSVKAFQGNAMNLKRFQDASFDAALLFGPMYHLFGDANKKKALSEALRVLRPGGILLVAYCMNEYSVVTYAFKEKHIMECLEEGRISEDFHTSGSEKDLYDYVRIEDIQRINEGFPLERIKIIAPDGPADYIRPFLNQLTEEEFQQFIAYQLSVCERQDLIGASSHVVDILQKKAE